MRIQKRPLRWRITGQGSGVALIPVATASMAHAHGGIAGPDDLGPPLFTSAALASICYWIVILWPVSKRKGSGDAPPGEMPVGKDRRYTMRTSRKAAPRRTSQLRKVGSNHARRGTQYTSIQFGARCRAAGVRPSMGSVGDCFDNAMCESFFATLECELLARRRFKTPLEARMAVFEFIEGWYNPHRRHSALDYLSPINYERTHHLQPLNPNSSPSTETG